MLKQKSSRCPYRQASQVTAFMGSFGLGSPFGGSLEGGSSGGSGSDGDLVIGSCFLRRAMAARTVTTQPLGSILEAKPLHQGQKTRILGRGSQSCSHLYSTLPMPSQGQPKTAAD